MGLLDLIYPPRCVVCGAVTANRAGVCANCRAGLPYIAPPYCNNCGATQSFCSCHGTRFHFDNSICALWYEKDVRGIIWRMKYKGNYTKGQGLARVLFEYSRERFDASGFVVVPVPLAKRRRKERGYNQSAIIARELAWLMGISYNAGFLKRIRETKPQFDLKIEERAANVAGAFVGKRRADGLNFIVVDDIFTTGSTLSECAKALKEVGAQRVIAMAVSKTQKRYHSQHDNDIQK